MTSTIEIKFYDKNGISLNTTIPDFNINNLKEYVYYNDKNNEIQIEQSVCGKRQIYAFKEIFPLGTFYIENKSVLHLSAFDNSNLYNSKILNISQLLSNIIKIYFNDDNFKEIKIYTINRSHPINKLANCQIRLQFYNDFKLLFNTHKLSFV